MRFELSQVKTGDLNTVGGDVNAISDKIQTWHCGLLHTQICAYICVNIDI